MNQSKRLVACPTCKKLVEFSALNTFRPFCSKRCEMIDLGAWANEDYAIPAAAKDDDLPDELTQ
ncbi:DNA gyrase inhibitor YacG [Methylotenera sp. L2L1]|uniref:DNA gyrase inhibitor YacG n=1 Tax=Methylotenera sp. L2L1 TaxID=1502770 RepID=UPI00055AA4BD|nr:DNA gyrase inhibitor YacG [Methylotenera sp. L2L1]